MSISWDNYNSKNSYDEYLTPDRKLRKEAKVISKILNSYSINDLEKIEQNCQSTISSRGINFKVYSKFHALPKEVVQKEYSYLLLFMVW